MDDIETLGMHRDGRPLRKCDLTVRPEEIHSWMEYLVPAGFREGIGAGLFSPDGRFLGLLGMHTESAVPASDAARDLLGMVAPMIAHAVDPLRSISTIARAVSDAVAGVVVTRAGATMPLPGLPAHPLLVAGSAVLRVAADQLARGGVHATFLSPAPHDAGGNGYLRVTAMPAPADPPYHFVAVLTVSPPGDLHGLTPRELEVLGLLVEGWPNQAMALGLGITERTVAAHVEHVLTKLAVTSRTVAAVSALRLGLFVPRLLHGDAVTDDHAER
jgi:DNA-binding CsgD family transcriptional regulator